MSTPLTDADITAILARAEAATPGPWAVSGYHEDDYGPHVSGANDAGVCIVCSEHPRETADAAFIANARTDIPDLCAEVERLRAALADAEAVRGAPGPLARAYRTVFAAFAHANLGCPQPDGNGGVRLDPGIAREDVVAAMRGGA